MTSDVSKLNAYAVLKPPSGAKVSKVNAYAIIKPKAVELSPSPVINTVFFNEAPAPEGYRFWRLLFPDGAVSDNYLELSEIEFRAFPTESSLDTTTGVASASSAWDTSSYAPQFAFDGLRNTAWGSAKNQHVGSWIAYEFPEPKNIVDVRLIGLNSLAPGRFPKSVQVQYSTDGVAWVDAWEPWIPPAGGSANRWNYNIKPGAVTYDGTPHKFWRMEFRERRGGYVDIYNFDMYDGDLLLTTGGIASASSQYGAAYSPANAFNQNTSNEWCTTYGAGNTDWLQYEFAAQVSPTTYYINPIKTDGSMGDPNFFLWSSDDGTNWKLESFIQEKVGTGSAITRAIARNA
ncbi:discoidin domain-containing protein [Ochrobactrum sp. WV_118_8]